MTRAVGIEILGNKIRLLLADAGGKRARIVGFVEQPISVAPGEDWMIPATAALKEALQISRAPKRRAVASLDSGDAVLRELTLPFKQMEELRPVVPNELESFIHNYAIEDLVVDFIKTGETEKASQILACAVPKKSVRSRLELLEACGVDPVALDLDVAALFNTLHHVGAVDTDEPFLILHGSTRFTKLLFVEGRKPKSIRTIRFSLPEGGDAEGRAPASTEAAEKERQTTEVPGHVPIVLLSGQDAAKFSELDFETRSSLMEILAKEISRFLLANAASATPAFLMVTGDFEDEESSALLEAATRIPTRVFPLLEAVDHPFRGDETSEVAPKLAIPLGLALKGAGMDVLGMDFRKGEFSFRKKYDAVKTTALVTLELVIAFLAAIALHFHFRTRDLREGDLAVLYDEHAKIFSAVFENEKPPAPEEAYEEMKRRMDALREKTGGTSDFPLRQTALEISGRLFRAFALFEQQNVRGAEGGAPLWVRIDLVNISQNTNPGSESVTVTVKGKTRNHAYAQRLLDEIKKNPLFETADFEGPLAGVPEGIAFTIKSSTKR